MLTRSDRLHIFIKYFTLLSFLFVFASCKKEKTIPANTDHPVMKVIELNDQQAGPGQTFLADIDMDGIRDLGFSTMLVGDPLLPGDKLQFYVTGNFDTWFAFNNADQSPLLKPDQDIHFNKFPGFLWSNAPALMLAQKVELVNGNIYWEGDWKTASHDYLPFYILRNGQRFFGWIELSFSMTMQKIIIHRIAVSTEAEKTIKTGKV
jgi:hypothetical protein